MESYEETHKILFDYRGNKHLATVNISDCEEASNNPLAKSLENVINHSSKLDIVS